MESKSLLLEAGRREMNGRGAEARGDNPAGQWRARQCDLRHSSRASGVWCLTLPSPGGPERSF